MEKFLKEFANSVREEKIEKEKKLKFCEDLLEKLNKILKENVMEIFSPEKENK